ncbi:ATP-binding cassette sub-family G member 5-like [Haliotis cracherodii]|uniref:ATP-binding cassette sub-family G member 5-like n=1 Tax=Haliotis cracherodii TaxID=6455 RepID=UPI0039E89FEC
MDISTLQDASPILRPTSISPLPTSGDTVPPVLHIKDVTYTVQEWEGPWWKGACFRKRRNKTVLNNISMSLRGGLITALIGSSGSGKTSLLDVIACRGEGQLAGQLYFRNQPCQQEVMKRHASYVMQADKLLPNLTVRETLTFTAYLKLPGNMSSADVESKVQEVIEQMGLRHVADSRIGGQVTRGVSGGEKRRVTIAIQLLQDPEILLLDEPTSGLDSYTSRYLVMNLAELAHREGKIILLSIHQPRSDIFKILDEIAILTQGHLAYFGKTSGMVPYFSDIGYPCPRYSNPLDVYIDVSSVDRRNSRLEEVSQKRVDKIIGAYRDSSLYSDIKSSIRESLAQYPANRASVGRRSGPRWFRVVKTLVSRMTLNLSRDKQGFLNRIVLMPAFVVFIAVFLGRLKNNQESIQDRAGLLYQSVSVPTHVAILNIVPLFPCIREVFYRECRDGLYSTTTFLAAYTIHMLPFSILASAIFSSFLYWAVGMSEDPDKFGMYVGVVCLLYFAGEFLTVANMGVFMDSQLVNNSTSLLFTASAVLSSGFLRAVPNMPEVFRYISYGMIHKYGSEIVAANEFSSLALTCEQNTKFVPCVFTNGSAYLNVAFPGAVDHIDRNFGILTGFSLSFVVLAYIAFKVRGIPNLH